MTKDRYRYFRIEAREIVDELGKGVLELETLATPELVAKLLRLAHTLKGAARVVKQVEIANDAHAIEDALAPARTGATVGRDRIDEVLARLDQIAGRVDALATPPAAAAVAADTASAPVAGSANAMATESPAPAAQDIVRDLPHAVADPISDGAELDTLIGGVAEAQAELATVRARITGGGDAFARVERELIAVRETAERLRLVPIRALFTTLARVARDAALAIDRRVTLDGHGDDVRLEAQVLRAAQAALVQAVRNAVAHGIEPVAERVAAGKPPVGRIVIEVVRRGGKVRFTCRDDGRGVDVAAVRRAAERRGLRPEAAAALSVDEVLGLLLGGGISTAAAITPLAGRGVGLDVVRAAARDAGGDARISTEPGRGTTIELTLPVSMASIESLTMLAGDAVVSIPLSAVETTLRLPTEAVTRTASGEAVVYEGKVVPFAPLSRILGGRRPAQRRTQAWSGVIVRGAGGLAAIGVDRLLGAAPTAVQPLPDTARASAVIGGAALDAHGDPVLALDPDALIAAARGSVDEPSEAQPEREPILVIDDSLTTRMLEQSILESAGYVVELATSAEEALDKAHRRRYALFLVDVEMPGMDGFTFIERIQSDIQLRHIPAILVTSRGSIEDRRRGEQVGARGYIVKSEFDQNQLLLRIRTLVG